MLSLHSASACHTMPACLPCFSLYPLRPPLPLSAPAHMPVCLCAFLPYGFSPSSLSYFGFTPACLPFPCLPAPTYGSYLVCCLSTTPAYYYCLPACLSPIHIHTACTTSCTHARWLQDTSVYTCLVHFLACLPHSFGTFGTRDRTGQAWQTLLSPLLSPASIS